MSAFDFRNDRAKNIADPIFDKDAVNLRTTRRIFNNFSGNTHITGNYLPLTGGTGGPYVFTGDTFIDSLSASTIFSGSTDLSLIFQTIGSDVDTYTHVQQGLNTYTGGSSFFPTVNVSGLTIDNINVSGNSVFNALSAQTISATTLYSGSTDLSNLFTSNAGAISYLGSITTEPTGFADRVTSTLSFDKNTRTFSILPTGSTFNYYVKGIKYTTTGSTQIIPDTNGVYYFYYNSSGVFTYSTSLFSILDDATIAYVIWNSVSQDGILCEERHGTVMDSATHYREHFTEGTKVIDNFSIYGYSLSPVSPVDSGNTYGMVGGTISDEDINLSIGNLNTGGPYTVLYRTGATGDWMWNTGNTVPLLYNTGAYAYYNNFPTTAWTLTQLTVNQYVNYYVCATNSLDNNFKYIIFPGQSVYSSLATANGEFINSLSFGSFPFVEIAPLYRITFRSSNSYSTSGKVRIENVSSIIDSNITITGINTAINHNSLPGLQGGISGQYFHLQESDYNNAINLTNLLGTKANLSGATFTGAISGTSISAQTLYSGSTDLSLIFQTIGSDVDIYTHVQQGLNTYTGGTDSLPTVNVSGLTIDNINVSGISSFQTISATTFYSGSTDLSLLFGQGSTGTATNVQGGVNIYTGGTALIPTVNLSNDIILGSISATSISATTFYSGSTDLSLLFGQGGTGSATNVQDGINTYTGGTDSLPTVNVSGLTIDNINVSGISSFQTISATTFYSGSTDLSLLFGQGGTGTATNVQGGVNIYTGGTALIPTINLSNDIVLNSISATSISATTFYSGSTELSLLMGGGSAPAAPSTFITLEDGATISWNYATSSNAQVTLTAATGTLAISGATNGNYGVLKVTQDGTGGRLLVLPTGSKVANGGLGLMTLTTNANAVDMISFVYDGSTYWWNGGFNYN
jgi:hypothetical protein